MESEVVGLEGRIPKEEVPLEMKDDLVNRVILLIHDLLPYLFEEETQ